ncbi:transposase [Mesorhizobium sp. M0862]|uniref:transposase n=1 Tax=Mesorhizobium sp. M0862 TaxID=2957015 RepID=UPI00333C6D8B
MTEPKAMEQAPDIGAVHAHTTHLQFDAKLIQRQFAGLGQPQTHKLGMRLKLAATHMALPARFERTGLPPQVDQIVHKARRNAEMARCLAVTIPSSTYATTRRRNSSGSGLPIAVSFQPQ